MFVTGVATRSKSVHKGIDGSTIEMSGDDVDLSPPATSVVSYLVAGRIYEFTASHRDVGRDVARDLGFSLDEAYSLQQGTLAVGSTTQAFPTGNPDVPDEVIPYHLASWSGRSFSIHTHLYGGTKSELVAVFHQFAIRETQWGVTLVPRGRNSAILERQPLLMKSVGGIGQFQIHQLTKEFARSLPRSPGTEVRGGELFVSGDAIAGSDCSELVFQLVSESAHALVLPDEGIDSDRLASRLSELVVGWQTE